MEKAKVVFDLELLRGKDIAVHCETLEQAQNFVEWVYSLENSINRDTNWETYNNLTCYNLEEDCTRSYCDKHWYLEHGCKVISYEEALLKPKQIETKGEDSMKLEEMIKVMEHFKNGGEVESTNKCLNTWTIVKNPSWNWDRFNYRIAQPKPKTITIEKWVMFDNTSKIYIVIETSDISSFERDYAYKRIKLLESYEVQED